MRKRERFLPPRVGRFNYWGFFRPGGIDVVAPLKHLIKRQFELILTASPEVWNKEVYPWLHRNLSDIPDRRFLALEGYVSDDKEWRCDGDAWKAYNGLSAQKQKRIQQLDKKKWGRQRDKLNWATLLQTIAEDQKRFEEFCNNPPSSGDLTGTDQRIYVAYSKQATMLLGGGRLIPRKNRKIYRDFLGDGSSLLTSTGRLPSQSIFSFRWKDLSPKDRREAKKQILHWFHHALRNMKEYRNNRLPVPWSSQCAAACDRIQKKLCNS